MCIPVDRLPCQVLFALNGVYLLNEKGAVTAVDGFCATARRLCAVAVSLAFMPILGGGAHATALDRLAR